MASGVTVSDDCKTVFEEIKKEKKHRYIIFMIRDDTQIAIEKIGERTASYGDFLDDLRAAGAGECRYGVYDFEYTHQCQGTTEERMRPAKRVPHSEKALSDEEQNVNITKKYRVSKKQKLFLMSWCPDTAKIKKKMLYSSSFDALKKSLVGVQKYIQATDLSEADEKAVEEKLRSTDRN